MEVVMIEQIALTCELGGGPPRQRRIFDFGGSATTLRAVPGTYECGHMVTVVIAAESRVLRR